MSILETFQKNFDILKSEYTEYKDYHDTMITIIPSILELLDSLFLEENIKHLENYNLLKEDYLDVIKRTLEPDNYRDVKFETELPDIYDAPRARREKAKKISKLKAQRVTTLPARVTIPTKSQIPLPISHGSHGSQGLHGSQAQGSQGSQGLQGLQKEPESEPEKNVPKVDKALKAYAEEGKRLYQSPLECEKRRGLAHTPPDKVLIELPDETKAYLLNDGKITDLKHSRELGKIAENGVVYLNNAELGKINLVDRDEAKFLMLTNNFGKIL